MLNKTGKITAILIALLLLPISVRAASTKADNSIYVQKGEIVVGNLYAAGQSITVDGTISGDLIGVGQNINVNGRVEGDVIVAGQNITINGQVGGNIRLAGDSLTINGSVARNVNAFGTTIILGPNSQVGWDVYLAGATAEMRGRVDGNLSGRARQALISGQIGENVDLQLGKNEADTPLIITAEAVINGDVVYTAKNSAHLDDRASVIGRLEQKTPTGPGINWFWFWIWGRVFSIFAALAVGLVLIFAGKNITIKILNQITETPTKRLLHGLIIMFILPPVALVLMFTIIGIPLALLALAWWLAMIYVAKIITAVLVGQLIIKRVTRKESQTLFWSLVLGLLVCWLLFSIPIIGWALTVIAIWFGLGGIWAYISQQIGRISTKA